MQARTLDYVHVGPCWENSDFSLSHYARVTDGKKTAFKDKNVLFFYNILFGCKCEPGKNRHDSIMIPATKIALVLNVFSKDLS